MTSIASYSIPAFIGIVLIYAIFKRINIWQEFTKGGLRGLKSAVDILPSLVGLVTAIEILSQSGALAALSDFLSPVSSLLGIPGEVLPLSLMRSVSGSGSIAVFQNILSNNSPDSYIARCAAVIMGSSETTFYTLSVYFSQTRAKKIRYCVFCALLGDLTVSIVACIVCQFL